MKERIGHPRIHRQTRPDAVRDDEPREHPSSNKRNTASLSCQTTGTRPGIAFAVSALSQHNFQHRATHQTTAKRVIRYSKGTVDLKLMFPAISTPFRR
jgi:hypothetical protein